MLQENRRHQNEILGILVREWNPHCFPEDQAAYEHEGEVPDIYRRLLARVSGEELARYLYGRDIVAMDAERFDSSRWAAAERVADKLLGLAIRA